MLNINKWITFMLQNQYFEIMEETNRNDQSDKPIDNPPRYQAEPAAGQVKTQVEKSHGTSASGSPAKPSAEGPEEIPLPSQGEVPGLSTRATELKSKKLEMALKKLKIQKKELASLEKNRDRLMKDLISAIEKKKKKKKIRNLARDFNRIEIRVKNKTASYMKAKKKLAN
jgi:hypothetical protein